ncbi:HAD family hydrolase [Acholeplasma laidlawii]|uniref:HAD family hydrolase n=1 Tax=Acholeplasma laidlawii TaxID=2148 RepID=UPI0021F748A0|nr:HAD hydrolase family protein [Acholeplasma laidlawii]
MNNKGFIEIISSNAGKEKAYQTLKTYYGLTDNQIVVVGDAINDLSLFHQAQIKVAVSNAIEEILRASTLIIENEDYLGIARLIEISLGE